jgi:hypothetical protein
MDKSMMKKAYKEAKRTMGVYGIKNARNDKTYIGFGLDLAAKFNRHKAELRFGTHRNKELQEAWNLFGVRALGFEVLDVLVPKENPQTDPDEELPVLLEMWAQKLETEGSSFEIL